MARCELLADPGVRLPTVVAVIRPGTVEDDAIAPIHSDDRRGAVLAPRYSRRTTLDAKVAALFRACAIALGDLVPVAAVLRDVVGSHVEQGIE